MYDVFNRKILSNYIFQDEICKGYSVHSLKGLRIWEMLLNCLLECFRQEFDNIRIINTVPQIINYNFLSNFYGEYFYRIINRIPIINNVENNGFFITTDALPYLVSNLNKDDNLFSTYTVVRPRTFAVKPFLREEFIRYFQFVISSDETELSNIIEKIKNATTHFFSQIRLSVVVVDRHSDSYYFKKSCFHSMWMNGNIESVLQCGLLRKRFDTASGNDRYVIDVGGAQRLLASFIYANSDIHGLFLPYHMRNYDIVIRADKKTKLLDSFVKRIIDTGCRIKYSHDNLPLKKIKKNAIEESVIAIVIQRIIDKKIFLTIYNRDMTKTDIYVDDDITKWIIHKYSVLERLTLDKQSAVIRSRINGDKLHVKKGNKSYTIIKDGLFN